MQSAPLPAQVIEQGLATPGLLAHVAVQKFCDHMPLARQSKFFARHGIELPRSTLTDWMLALGLVTQPLIERVGEWLKTHRHPGERRHAAAVAERARRQDHHRAAVGVARRDRRATSRCCSISSPPDRSGEHAAAFLAGWRGYLQADAYSGYDRNFVGGQHHRSRMHGPRAETLLRDREERQDAGLRA